MVDREFIDKNGRKQKRQPCMVFTRVMGYLRPVQNYNPGKKSEFYDRKYFVEGKGKPREYIIAENNKEFVNKYTTKN